VLAGCAGWLCWWAGWLTGWLADWLAGQQPEQEEEWATLWEVLSSSWLAVLPALAGWLSNTLSKKKNPLFFFFLAVSLVGWTRLQRKRKECPRT